MSLSNIQVPKPVNESVFDYAPDSEARLGLKAELNRQRTAQVKVPIIIGGQEVFTETTGKIACPHDHQLRLGEFPMADGEIVQKAVRAALKAKDDWQEMGWEDRAAIFLKAAELMAGRYRHVLNAATMLGQSKSVHQAELDTCELTDYLRFNVSFMERIYSDQIAENADGNWTRLEYRPLEGFVFAVTPFNFTAIAGNLPSAPAMMGNVIVWKPAFTAVLSGYYVMRIFQEAGLPDGVINFLPARGRLIGEAILNHRDFAGLHFTGSTDVFNGLWKRVADNLSGGVYRSYPRLVGETGGKGFVIACKDADVDALSVALFRGAFEYQGQKCSAASRAYVPRSLWPEVKKRLARMAGEVQVGDVGDFKTFMGAVIDKESFDNIVSYIEHARSVGEAQIVIGGRYDEKEGYFIWPTVIETSNPKYKSMEEEIFGPVLTVYVYEDDRFEETLELVDETSPYALTGAVFGKDRLDIRKATKRLIHAAGNFYINDKPTGAVVGQQPFGGARLSGTNDKAGSHLNLLRWVSPRTVKECFVPPAHYAYPHMEA